MLVAVIRCASVRVTLVGVERVRPCVTHTLLSSNATTGREARARTQPAIIGARMAARATSGAAGAATKICMATDTNKAGATHEARARTGAGVPTIRRTSTATPGASATAYHHVTLTPARRM